MEPAKIRTSNTHWFKKLFLGLMGSVALTKAVDSYYKDILKFNSIESLSDFWERFYTVLASPERLCFHVVTALVLVYFLANIVRYYMAIFIYEHFTNEVWKGLYVGKSYKILHENEPLRLLVESKLSDDNMGGSRKFRRVQLTIGDLVLSLIIFFLFGIAGYSIANTSAFALCMIAILLMDLLQIIYQRRRYFPEKKKLFSSYRNALLQVLLDDDLLEQSGVRVEKAQRKGFKHDLEANTSDDHGITLENWMWVDLREMIIWIAIIVLELWLANMNKGWLWLQLIPLALLFLSYFYDIKKNQDAWADMFDLEIK